MRIPPSWLDCTFYVYKSVAEAKAGANSGGSGCLVGVPSIHEGWVHVYAVTNKHLIDNDFGVLRLNTSDGKSSSIETQWTDWVSLSQSGDVAVMPLEIGAQFRWKPIFVEEFISRETAQEFNIWPGDEAFMIGRLITQSGKQRNTPVVRFGNLSMLADPIEQVDMGEYGEHEAFLVECRSLSGFSGSPVFLTTTQSHQPKDGKMPRERKYTSGPVISIDKVIEEESETVGTGVKVKLVWMEGTFGPWFIGIDRGHVPLWKPIYEPDSKTETKYRVEHNTGMAVVIPAWRIVDLLNTDELVKQRIKDDEEIKHRNKSATVADLEGK